MRDTEVMTLEQITAAEADELSRTRECIEEYLAPLAGVTIMDKHHRALIAHIRTASHTMKRSRDLRSAKKCAEDLHIAYTRPRGHKFAVRALEALAERADEPFKPTVDLGGGFGSIFRP